MRKDKDDQRHVRDEYQRAMQYGATNCVLPEFQWFPKGIQFESAFNRFISRETDRPKKHTNALLILRKGKALDRLLALISAVKKTVKAAMPKAQGHSLE